MRSASVYSVGHSKGRSSTSSGLLAYVGAEALEHEGAQMLHERWRRWVESHRNNADEDLAKPTANV